MKTIAVLALLLSSFSAYSATFYGTCYPDGEAFSGTPGKRNLVNVYLINVSKKDKGFILNGNFQMDTGFEVSNGKCTGYDCQDIQEHLTTKAKKFPITFSTLDDFKKYIQDTACSGKELKVFEEVQE
jgi:hypothetical protein